MATNGKSVINGKSVWGKTGMECLGFVGAEAASMITSLCVIAVADQLIPKSILNQAYKTVGKVLEPWLLDPYEWAKRNFCRLEECKVDDTKSRQQRAEDMARTILLFSTAWVAAMRVKVYSRDRFNKWLGVDDHCHENKKFVWPEGTPFLRRAMNVAVPWDKTNNSGRMVITADELVHYGSILLMNVPFAGVTDEIIRSTKNVLKKVGGFSDQKAQDLADMAAIWEMPNFLGAVAGFGAIAAKHHLGWPEANPTLNKMFSSKIKSVSHVERLAQSTSLSGGIHK